MTRTAIAIPAYDAESSIGEVVRRAREILPEVIVVDDGSVDATGPSKSKDGTCLGY